MKTVKDKLYNFEQQPPEEIWDNINSGIDVRKVININANRKRTRIIALTSAAAAVIIIILISTIFNKKLSEGNLTAHQSEKENFSAISHDDSAEINYEALKTIIQSPQSKKLVAVEQVSNTDNLKYITISGPGGEPVKISPKVATLIISADKENPPKPIWSREIGKWQKLMLFNNITPTSANLMTIIQKASNSIE